MYKSFNFNVQQYTNYLVRVVTNVNNMIKLHFTNDIAYGYVDIKNTNYYEFEYYNGNFTNITINARSINNMYTLSIVDHPVKIQQIYVNKNLKLTFLNDIIKCYNLREYHDYTKPSFFYGMFDSEDLMTLAKHKSLKVVIWVGGDINYNINRTEAIGRSLKINIDKILRMTKLKHVSISSFISKSLQDLNLPFKMVPFMGVDFSKYQPVRKGPCIYLYTATGGSESYYGYDIYMRLLNKYSHINFIITCCSISYEYAKKNPENLKHEINYYSKQDLVEKIYPQCFLGLRLTQHDGLAGTVQELGLLGIKCIHNGCSPSSLNYETFEDICRHIDDQYKTIGQIDAGTAELVKSYLTIDASFFDVNYHR